ncbi:hypothetical protein ACCS33_35730, partial [Rhizobium ruizarguesonis]
MIAGGVGDLTWRFFRSAGYRILRLLQVDVDRWRREDSPVKPEANLYALSDPERVAIYAKLAG